MITSQPLQRIFGGSQSAVLEVLLGVSGSLSIRQIAGLAGVSEPAAARALRTLETQGVVASQLAGSANMFQLNEAFPFAPALRDILRLAEKQNDDFARQLLRELDDKAVNAIVLFGSAARNEESPTSDIDVLVVVEDSKAVERIAPRILNVEEAMTKRINRPVQLVVQKAPSRADMNKPFWKQIAADGRLLHGVSPIELANG